jgi:hypothetical protein
MQRKIRANDSRKSKWQEMETSIDRRNIAAKNNL